MDIRDRIVELRRVRAEELLPNPKNWRKHPERQRAALREMVARIGFAGAELVRELPDGRLMLIDGHLRRDTFGQALLPVLVTDLDEAEADALLATYDPIGAMAEADGAKLGALLDDVSGTFEGVAGLLDELAAAYGELPAEAGTEGDPGAALDRAEELQAKWQVERGQVWQIGRHRLMCGDSYDEGQRALLMAGKRADMLHTDPPYGINAVIAHEGGAGLTSSKKRLVPGKARHAGSTARRTTDAAERSVRVGAMRHRANTALIVQPNLYPVIEGDDRPFDPTPFLELAPITILWGANNYAQKLPPSQAWIVWDKREAITRNDFSDCELAWANAGKASRVFHHLWNGLHKGSQHGERRLHPTEKPVALFEEIGKMYAPGGLWLDLFAGSGPQLVAAERTGATCYAMECEPLYVATMLERLAGMGLAAAITSDKRDSVG